MTGQLMAFGIYLEAFLKVATPDECEHIKARMGEILEGRNLERALAGIKRIKAAMVSDILYYIGIGVSQDFAKAFHWFKKAAAKGDPDALYNLGELYEQGKGVAPDLEKAREWYQKAGEAGDEEACEAYARLNR